MGGEGVSSEAAKPRLGIFLEVRICGGTREGEEGEGEPRKNKGEGAESNKGRGANAPSVKGEGGQGSVESKGCRESEGGPRVTPGRGKLC